MLLPFSDDFNTSPNTRIKCTPIQFGMKTLKNEMAIVFYSFHLYVLLDFRHLEIALFTQTHWDFSDRQGACEANKITKFVSDCILRFNFSSPFRYQRFDVIPRNRLCKPCMTNKHRNDNKICWYDSDIVLCLVVSTRIRWASIAKICCARRWGRKNAMK